jgi:hypothetical protein
MFRLFTAVVVCFFISTAQAETFEEIFDKTIGKRLPAKVVLCRTQADAMNLLADISGVSDAEKKESLDYYIGEYKCRESVRPFIFKRLGSRNSEMFDLQGANEKLDYFMVHMVDVDQWTGFMVASYPKPTQA